MHSACNDYIKALQELVIYFRKTYEDDLKCHEIDETKKSVPRYCLKYATTTVSWSDRSCDVCDDHIELVKHYAANDNSGDRTDNPYIRKYGLPTKLIELNKRLEETYEAYNQTLESKDV